jgi:HTH-type transcriptional regulator / antitoxin HigA
MGQTTGPARLVPPGRIIARELEARGWQQRDLAEIMGRPEQAISEIINDKKQITPETARELASAFGTSVDLWMGLEANYRLHLAQRQAEEEAIRRRARLYSVAPYGELVSRAWIGDRDGPGEQEWELCRFLGVSSLDEEPRLAMAARHSAHGEPERLAQIAWAKRVEHLARRQSVEPYDAAQLEAMIPRLLDLTVEPEDLHQVPPRLLRMGVHFVIVPHLRQTYLDGAALYVDDHPVVALTLRYDRLDNVWFTLLHELAHIALGHQGAFLDRLDDERVMTDEEQQADVQARDWLIDRRSYDRFVRAGTYTPTAIRRFASEQRRHPAIVVGCLQHDALLSNKRFAGLRVRVREYLEPWIDRANGEAPTRVGNHAT